jgi:ORF6N domain
VARRKALIIPDEVLISKILLIREKKVMIDRDLADLYKVSTKRLNEQVKRNIKRFPEDFMFQLTEEEKAEVVAICDHLKSLKYSSNLPYAFTEHGAVMLASVLNSERAIRVNIQIIRVFNQMRKALLNHKDILLKLEQLERQTLQNTGDIQVVFNYIKQLIMQPEQQNRKRIGFRRQGEE